MNAAQDQYEMSPTGTTSATLAFGGTPGPQGVITEEWNGTGITTQTIATD